MKVYTDPLADIQAFYSQQNLLTKISGEASIEEVVSKMQEFIKTKISTKI
jgi:adenylate kinase